MMQRTNLEKIKDAIAEAHNQHASALVKVDSSHFGSPLIEEVLGAHAPAPPCSIVTTCYA